MIMKMENNYELRYLSEIRADVEQGIVKGTAIVFNTESKEMRGFKEVIKPEAVTKEFLDKQDIVMLYNHDESAGVLARSKNGKGSLKYDIDERGVNFEFKPKAKHKHIIDDITNGDLDSCSFAFRVADKGDKYERRNDGSVLRTITKFEAIRDFSIVVFPSYKETNVSTRSFDEFKEQINLEDKIKEEEERKIVEKKEELNKYFEQFKKY